MIDQQPVDTAVRRRRREARLGDGPRVCILFGQAHLENFVSVTGDWLKARGASDRLLEDHHLVGKRRDPKLTVPLCRNCHGDATESLATAGISMLAERDSRSRVATILDALAVFFEMLVNALRRWAHELRTNATPPAKHA